MFFNPQLMLFEKPGLSTAVETAWLAVSSNRSDPASGIPTVNWNYHLETVI
jgi:hypothetical protein